MFRTQRRIEFRDTDAAGIAHFSVFFTMMESAEHELIRSLGFSVLGNSGLGNSGLGNSGLGNEGPENSGPENEGLKNTAVTWPRVAASCDYQSVARFEDLLDLDLSIKKLGNSSVQYEIRFSKASDGLPPTQVAVGSLTAVCCELHPGGSLKKVTIPDVIRQQLQTLVVPPG
ncbi:acyl-CoA thioesterase [Novipirellula aureliae]|uniref:acyl-CoA thioesterase n=1 Tax=Novipirellula aureliae TaxID=2527966 RepID=UPI001E41F9AC|nr:thioesterase family protein [Novipirellula aureliae]